MNQTGGHIGIEINQKKLKAINITYILVVLGFFCTEYNGAVLYTGKQH